MKLNVERQIFVVHRRIGKLVFSDTKQNQITKFRRVANFFIFRELLNDRTIFEENREEIVRADEVVVVD